MKYFLFVIIFLPLIEIYFFVQIGTEIGALSSILLTLFTAFLGMVTIKYQGMSSFTQARQSILNTHNPGVEMLSKFLFLVSGIFLFIPGFFTDFLGVILLFPFSRVLLVQLVIAKLINNYQNFKSKDGKEKDYIDIDPDN